VQNDEWGSGGYPSIYAGCHWGSRTRGGLAAHPVPVRALANPGTVTTSWHTTHLMAAPPYDIWFNQAPTTTGQPNGAELMVWLRHQAPSSRSAPQSARQPSTVSGTGCGKARSRGVTQSLM
jgi:hypothetical protein